MPKRVGKFAWDSGLDYGATRERLVNLMIVIRPECQDDLIPKQRLSKYSILLSQLVNGARVSEAFDAVSAWSQTGTREQAIKVRKLGRQMRCKSCGKSFKVKSKTNSPTIHEKESGHRQFEDVQVVESRLVVVPSECLEEDRHWIVEAITRGVTIGSVKAFASRTLGFNTHSLRYAKITSLTNQNKPAQMIAKITHHRNMNFIVDYTQQKAADEELRKSIG